MSPSLNLQQRINLCILFLKQGGEIIIDGCLLLVIPEGTEDPGYKFSSSGKVIQIGSLSAWSQLITHAKGMTNERTTELIKAVVLSSNIKVAEIKERALASEPGDLFLTPAEEFPEMYGPSYKGTFGIESPDHALVYPDGRLGKADAELFMNARRDILHLIDLLESVSGIHSQSKAQKKESA